jgi:hypothetical protein
VNGLEVCTMSICVNDDLVFASIPVQTEMRHGPGFQEHLLRGLRGSLAEAIARRLQPDIHRTADANWDVSNPWTHKFICTAETRVNGTKLSQRWSEPLFDGDDLSAPAIRADAERQARYELAAAIVDRVEPMVHWRPAELFDRGPGLQGNTALQPWRGELTVTAGNRG